MDVTGGAACKSVDSIFHAHESTGSPTNKTGDLHKYWIPKRGYPVVCRNENQCMKTRVCLLLCLLLHLPALSPSGCHAQLHLGADVADVSKIDTLWPVKAWSISYEGDGFPHAEYPDACEGPGCVIKGFAMDGRERFYVLGGDPKVSLACYDGGRQVWKREMGISLRHSIFGLMKTRGDSIYFLDEERFRMWRVHRDGHGKALCVDLKVSPGDSLAWGCVYDDRFRLQIGRKADLDKPFSRVRVRDVCFDGKVQKPGTGEARFDHEYKMYGGDGGGDVLLGFDWGDCVPLHVRTASGDTIREVKFFGAPPSQLMTSIAEPGWGVVMPPTLFARVGDWLYMPGYAELYRGFIIRKYDARPLWRWMKEAGI